MNDSPTPSRGKPSRRTVLAGAAWLVPAVAVVAAAPQATASVILSGDAIISTGFGAQGGQSWETPYIAVNFSYYYQWYQTFFPAGNLSSEVPPQLVTHWTVTIEDSNGNVVATRSGQSVILAQGAQLGEQVKVPGESPYLNRGQSYRVKLSITTDPALHDGKTFQATSPIQPLAVTVVA